MQAAASRLLNNRWTIALSGATFMMTLGTIYSWSLFAQPLLACFGWSNTTVTWAFALAIFSLGTGAVVGGRWQDRVGPRKVALTGVLLWSLGNVLAGLGTSHFGAVWLYLTYGLIGGLGVGMGYVTPVAVVTKWFPGHRGLAGGIVVMGFGLGAVLYNFILKSVPSFAAAAEAASSYTAQAAAHGTVHSSALLLAQNHVLAIMNVFLYSGVAFAVIAGVSAASLINPPDGPCDADGAGSTEAAALTTREMLRMPQFYLLWLMLFFNVTAGILVIGNAVPIMQELTSLTPAILAATYGGVALFNALGRFFWGAISDRIGGIRTFGLIFGIQVVVFGTLGGIHNLIAVAIAYAIVLLCFGGGFGTMPSLIAKYFGARHMGANYGAILTAWGAAGVVGPLFAALVKDATGSYTNALLPVAGMLLIAVLLPVIIRKPLVQTRSDPRPSRLS
ncbi:MAG TPA: OFA family MFS transporter [Candidatus Acidoferrales bacterium]|nr:OFA family MFS transporter [Candidatus Acidoferrales bacterium]